MDSNPCVTRWGMKKLGRKKTGTKVVHKNLSQGYDKVKHLIMKNQHFCYVRIEAKFGQDQILEKRYLRKS